MVSVLMKSGTVILISHLTGYAWGDDTFGDFYPKERALMKIKIKVKRIIWTNCPGRSS